MRYCRHFNALLIRKVILTLLACLVYGSSHSQIYIAPSTKFDLKNWKLQIPGPLEIKDLENYGSPYFYLTPENFMHFHLDASEKGTTPNASTVRDELRNLQNWNINEDHELSTIIRLKCNRTDCKATIIQIKSLTADNESAPPFLRIAVEGQNLYAHLKENIHHKTTGFLLKTGVINKFLSINVKVKNFRLIIIVDDEELLSKDVNYWVLNNHFKMGCYPQQTEGIFDIDVKELIVK